MMTSEQIETATREQLADEFAAVAEYTEDWATISIEDMRQQVRDAVAKYSNMSDREKERQELRKNFHHQFPDAM